MAIGTDTNYGDPGIAIIDDPLDKHGAMIPCDPAMKPDESFREDAESGVADLLAFIGIPPDHKGTQDTPMRVVKAFAEMTEGYSHDPEEILSKRFDAEYDQMVILRDIDFTSLCEHHLLPFVGTATIGYIPSSQVVGLSKLARLTHCFSRRLQLQEQMTTQIANAIMEFLKPEGVGVIVKAQHQCMACRGIKVSGATMVTSALLGQMRTDLAVRTEFLRLSQ